MKPNAMSRSQMLSFTSRATSIPLLEKIATFAYRPPCNNNKATFFMELNKSSCKYCQKIRKYTHYWGFKHQL